MKASTRKIVIRGPGSLTLVTLLFLTLKLAQIGLVASWSWWWVFAPLWAIPALSIAATIAGGVVLVLFLLLNWLVYVLPRVLQRRET